MPDSLSTDRMISFGIGAHLDPLVEHNLSVVREDVWGMAPARCRL